MTSYEWISSLRHLNCMEKADFLECFGKNTGAYLWDKFVNEKNADVFSFLCYLDLGNADCLYVYLMNKMEGEEDKCYAALKRIGLV